jgi:hypothetical protein
MLRIDNQRLGSDVRATRRCTAIQPMRSIHLMLDNRPIGQADQAEPRELHRNVFDIAKRDGFVHFVATRQFGRDRLRGVAITSLIDPSRCRVQAVQPAVAPLEKEQFIANDLRNGVRAMQHFHARSLPNFRAGLVGRYS